MHNSYNFFLNPHISFHTRVKNPEKIRIITSKWEVMLYYVRRYILIRNFKPLHIIHYLAQKLCFWTGIIFIGVYVSVCVCVCL